MEYYSHVFFDENNKIEKKKLLETHFQEVYDFSIENLPTTFLNNLKKEGYAEDDVKMVLKIISFCHDFGKFNIKFQEFIGLNPKEKKEFKYRKLKEHSLISALFGFFIAKKIFKEETEKFIFLRSLIFYLIKLHHSNLEKFEDEMHFIENINLINCQIKLIGRASYDCYSKIFKIKNIESGFKEFITGLSLQGFFSEKFDEIEENLFKKNKEFSFYFLINTLFSILHDADVHSASDINYKKEVLANFDYVKEHIKKMPVSDKKINIERNEILWELDKKSQKIDLNKRIYQITSPTGSGKTLSSLNFALQLKKRLKEKEEYKIIYSIPFTSIIDQTFDIFANLLKDSNNSLPKILLRHHHLADSSEEVYKNETETYIPPELNSVIVESWNFDLIITTFIQFFESIITNNKEMIKKIHNLYNSIIIVDECQNIPVNYWDTLKNLITCFCSYFDSYIIFLTATQPLIFDKGNENSPVELLDNYQKYFKNKNRTELVPIFGEKELGEFYESVKEIILKNNYSSILLVLNTIKDSQEIFKKIDEDTCLEDYKKIYLSASLIPKTKLKNVEIIKELNKKNKTHNKEKYIAVSTQLIEAGVDIDNEVIFRDFAPFENIIQTAGRCNREGERGTEKVYLFSIKKNERQRASTIYDSYLLNITKKIFSENEKTHISESNYLELFERYIEKKRESSNMALLLEKSIQRLNYYDKEKEKEPISSFKIIKPNTNKVSCFIDINEDSHFLLSKYYETQKNNVFKTKTKNWLPYKNGFQMYVVDIPEKIVQSKINTYLAKNQKKPRLVILTHNEWRNYYNENIGYTDSEGVWL